MHSGDGLQTTPAGDEPEIEFMPESDAGESRAVSPWTVLIVDDDPEVHESTTFALRDVEILGRPLRLLHAYSAAESLAVLQRETQVAVILLDVVMETVSAGLDVIEEIRGRLGLQDTRIILRTGQPGFAPDERTVAAYDINDYRTKSELTRAKLFVALFTAIRAYDQLHQGLTQRHFLQGTLDLTSRLSSLPDLVHFARGLVAGLEQPLGVPVLAHVFEVPPGELPADLRLLAGPPEAAAAATLATLGDAWCAARVWQCAASRGICMETNSLAAWIGLPGDRGLVVVARAQKPVANVSLQLMEVLCRNLDLSASTVVLSEHLRLLAYFDPLLGLPNRTALLEELARRLPDRAAVLALLDIDGFAGINDMFGDDCGDQLLQAFAARVRALVGEQAFLARTGPDQLALLTDGLPADGPDLGELCRESFQVGQEPLRITAGIGLVQLFGAATLPAQALQQASLALKRAKDQGRGGMAWFDADYEANARARMQLLQAFADAPTREQLSLAFQPQWDIASGRICGVEALLRWRDASGTMVPPDRFIPVIESAGLIVETGEWVLRTALQALLTLREAGWGELRMGVNVSVLQLQAGDFVGTVRQALADSGLPAQVLELEITESLAVTGEAQLLDTLHALKALGVSLAIDDFGTGYSSLSYLDRMPVDRVKIDRSFTRGLRGDGRSNRIAELMVSIGHHLNMRVLAEGIETPEQAQALALLGCDEGQGYLRARPMPLAELQAWLQAQPGGPAA
ncbi:EAL domain-containing protein [Pelomonas sp. UHG3]|uniref:EAL domain-containing protein n=1 Tax=Roseateles hydrophilus TaxID=2975054 RepID=A0ACC6C5U3_9BURK|nr:EAL domain-containing protein [Pelomonas sp. UHG3]MCY4743760.1 EAL domain-containing protein [Pelomonas sp. UHG3]